MNRITPQPKSAEDALRDAMIAEMLGDIQKLHTAVKQLPRLLQTIPDATSKVAVTDFATKVVAGGMLVCALVFGGTGYLVRMASDEMNLQTAKEKVAAAIERAEAAEQRTAAQIADLQSSMGWLGTKEGQLAKRFFDSGAGVIAATCNSPAWEVAQGADGRYCIPKRRALLGGEKERYGWKIP